MKTNINIIDDDIYLVSIMISKILGGLSIIGGLIFILVFPDITEFQSRPFSRTGIIIGGILILLGIYLIKS